MKYGIASNAFRKRGLSPMKSMKEMRKCGFETVDYGLLVSPETEMYRMSDENFDATIQSHRALIEESGLWVSQIHGPWRYPPHDADPDDRRIWFEYCKRAIRACAMIGSPYFVIHPLMPFGDVDEDIAFVRKLNLEFFRKLCAEGEKNGVVICIENMPFGGQALARVAPMLEFVKEINSPWLKVCLDTGHCASLGDSVVDAVHMLGKEYLAVLHVHDNDGEHDRHWAPGTGVIDWEAFVKALEEIGFEGSFSLETVIPEMIPNNAQMCYPREFAQYLKDNKI